MKDYNLNRLCNLVKEGKKSLTDLSNSKAQTLFDWIAKRLQAANPDVRTRLYPLEVTFKLFLQQTLSADGSCQEVVNDYCAKYLVSGQKKISSSTAGYCKAKQRLPESLLKILGEELGKKISKDIPENWNWLNRQVKLVDGTTLSMPDTEANQAEYPQSHTQEPGIGFPLMRWVTLICLGTGAITGSEISPCKGKYTGESNLLKKLFKHLAPGDVLVGDSIYCSFFTIYALQKLGVDVVFEKTCGRNVDFRTGKKLSSKDHIATWSKTTCPDWMEEETYEKSFPDEIQVREFEIKKGNKRKVIVTTMLDYDKKNIEELYKMRWNIELDLRSIKDIMGMGILRCKDPSSVRKEVSMHIIAYNIIRYLIALSGRLFDKLPRCLSFKVALQGVNSLLKKTGKQQKAYFFALLQIISERVVNNRPNRVEPRYVKRRPKPYQNLRENRVAARARIMRSLGLS